MGKIYYIMGKSSSGKDTIFKELLVPHPGAEAGGALHHKAPPGGGERRGGVISSRTRSGSPSGGTGRIIELRAYDTACGVWKYFTADDGQIDLGDGETIS